MNAGLSFVSPQCPRLIKTVVAYGLLFGVVGNATAQEAPEIINRETGMQVDLIRPYWNANVDIANRRIQCKYFQFNEQSAAYETREYGPGVGHGVFFHNPLPEGGGAGIVDDPYPGYHKYIGWLVTDGVYSGMAPLGSRGNPFLELVTYHVTNDVVQNNAVRSWGRWSAGRSYNVCYDLDGAPLRPTGSAEIGNTDLLPEQNFSFQIPPLDAPITATPEIVRLDTGEPVKFVRAEFDYNGDIVGNQLFCWYHQWNEESGRYVQSYKPEGASIIRAFPYAYTGGPTVLAQSAPDDFELETYSTDIESFMSDGAGDASFIEVDGSGYNVWGSSPRTFYRCEVGKGFAANKILLTPEDTCDYNAADQYDGWGWNPATQKSCPPIDADNCDYRHADQHDGWGWDPIAKTSCAPIESNDSSNCVDTDGDGWGWDGTKSCLIIAAKCVDTDGDGWGWDGSKSCRID